jgi:hypothetical protein
MPRFYFHYRDPDDQLIEDHFGYEQADIHGAEREAQVLAAEILQEELREGKSLWGSRSLEIENEDGEIVLYLPFWASILAPPTKTKMTLH